MMGTSFVSGGKLSHNDKMIFNCILILICVCECLGICYISMLTVNCDPSRGLGSTLRLEAYRPVASRQLIFEFEHERTYWNVILSIVYFVFGYNKRL